MNAKTIEKLADLLIDLDRAGVMVVPNGDTLRYHPKSAMTPDLAERLTKYKSELLAALRPHVPAAEPVTARRT